MPMHPPPTAPVEVDLATVEGWRAYLTEVATCIRARFVRAEARHRALASIQGLLSPAERKNGWQLAEVSGDATPYGVQHLLGRALWDADAVRDDLRSYVLKHLGDPEAVGVLDETGFVKKGQQSAGVARQYSGTAGRVENCQIGVFLTYTSACGHALLDRELYVPQAGTNDPARCKRAGMPAKRRFATKPQLAQQMLERTCAAKVPAVWVTGDSVYGDDRRLRVWLESQDQAYVLAVSGKEYVWLGWQQRQGKTVLAALPADGWTRLSAGAGAKGPRLYDWCWLPLANPMQPGWRRWLLVRRSLGDPAELRAYVVFAPHDTSLDAAVAVAGKRGTIESCFAAAKGDVGLDHYEVRSWTGWYRHITLAMWAYALLTMLRAAHLPAEGVPKKTRSQPQPSSLAAFKATRGLLYL
jgi:SRSO17 transposase